MAMEILPVGQPGPAAARPRRIGRQQQFQHRPQGHRAVRLAIYLLVVAVGIAGCASHDRRILALEQNKQTSSAPYPGNADRTPFVSMSTTLGQKHNNYLNLKNDPQKPSDGSTGTHQHGHAITSDPGHSYE